MSRSSTRRVNSKRSAAKRNFFAAVEQLERRDLLASVILDLVDLYAYERGPFAKFRVILDTPSTTPWYFTINYGVGSADGSDIQQIHFDPMPDLGSDWSNTITEVEITFEAYDDGAGNEDVIEELNFYVDAYTSDGHLDDSDRLFVVDSTGVGPSFAPTSDTPGPGCPGCGPRDSRSFADAMDGDLLITSNDWSIDGSWSSYLPQYSTSPLRDAIASADTRFTQAGQTPLTIEVEVHFNSTTTPMSYYDATTAEHGDTFRIAEPLDVSSLSPGSYPWTMEIREVYASGSTTYFIDGAVLVEGDSNALLSPGWSIPGVDRLTVTPAGALWQAGPNELYWFTEIGGNYIGPSGDYSNSTLVENMGGSFTLETKWGESSTFSAAGLLIERRDRNGNATTFTYTDADSDLDYDDILEIDSYDGRTLTYAYDGGLMVGITDFDGREIEFDYDGSDRLDTIIYPDPDDGGPLNALVSEYTYESATDFVATSSEAGEVTAYEYTPAGSILNWERPGSASVQEFQDVLTLPLAAPGFGTISDPASLTLVEGIVAIQKDGDGYATTYVLGPFGSPMRMVDAEGNETVYGRDSKGRLTSETGPDPDGAEVPPVTAYEYDGAGNLIEMTLPNGGIRIWTYDATWNIPDSYTDERGLLTTYTIAPSTGWVEETRQVVGNVDDGINLETDDIVTTTEYTPDPSGPTDPPAGLVEKTVDALGKITFYEYNARGDATSVTYADGTADEATVKFSYNSDGTLDYQLDELSRRTDFEYDLLGRTIKTTLPDPDGGGPLGRPEIEYEYDAWNQLTKETDPLGRETIYTYNKSTRTNTVERPDHDGDSKLTVTTTTYNGRGLVETVKDPIGRVTSYTYDKLGRQVEEILPEVPDPSTAVNEIQIIDFDSATEGTFKLNGNSKTGTVDLADLSNLQSVLDSLWGKGSTSVTYDSTEATVKFKGDHSATNVAQMTITDVTGTKGATPSVSTDTAGVAATLVNPTTTTVYDKLGRISSSKDARDQVTTYSYEYTIDGQKVTITLPDPDGGGGALPSPEMERQFDLGGNLISETDANGGETIRTYDVLGRLTKVTQPDPTGPPSSPVTEYQYDLAGNLRYATDPLGNVTEYQYDHRHRQVKIISADPDGKGSLSAMVTENEYDDAGQVTSVTAAGSRLTTFSYDGLGRTTKVTAPDPDGVGDLKSPVTLSAYDAAGQLISTTDPLGIVTRYEYDLLGNPVRQIMPDPDGSGGQASPVTLRKYDAAGQLAEVAQGHVVNEVQRLYYGSKASPAVPTGKSYALLFDGNVISYFTDADGASEIQAAMEAFPAIGAGNISVTETEDGYAFEFRGELAGQDVPTIALSTYPIFISKACCGVSVTVDAAGTPSTDEVQFVNFGAATTGTFDISGNGSSATVYYLDDIGLQAALNSLFGSGNTYVSSGYIYFAGGAFEGQDIPELTVSSNATDGTPSFSTITDGSPGSGDIVTVALTGTPEWGSFHITQDSIPSYQLSFNIGGGVGMASYLSSAGLDIASVTGDAGGPFTITSNYPHSWDAFPFYPGYPELDFYYLSDYIGAEIVEEQAGGSLSLASTTYQYDNLGRLIAVNLPDPDGVGGATAPITHYEYDLNGNQVKLRDPLQLETTYDYDYLNRRTKSIDSLGGETTFVYDSVGNLKTLTDPVGNVTSWYYDELNRVIEEKNQLNYSRFFTYDPAGNLVQKEDRLGRFTVYEYDNLHRQIAEEWWESDIYPTIDVTTSTPGGGGNNEVQVVALSNTTGGMFRLGFGGGWSAALDWDATTGEVDSAVEALSGAGTVSVSGSTGGPWTITFTGAYADQDIAPLFYRRNDLTNADLVHTIAYGFNDDGDLEQVNDPDATYDYVYDGMGRVTNLVQNITGLNPEIEFESTYNEGSRRTQLQTYFDSTKDFKNSYVYDDMQRLSASVQQAASGGNVLAPKRIEFAYNEVNQFTSINRYAATSATEFVAASYYTYDDMNRLTKLVHSESTTAPTSSWGSDPLAGYQFNYDAGSRITSINSYLDGVTDYAHDDTNQLVGADHAAATDESYEYDANGNRIMSGYDVDPHNQLYSDGTYNYTYDAEGNRQTRTKISNGYVTRYEWDFRNRLVKVTEEDNASGVLQFTENFYNAYNQWLRRSFDSDGPSGTAATDTFFVYENAQIVLQFDGSNDSDLSHRYLWGEQVDQLFADESVTSLGSAGSVIWPLSDHLGTLRELVAYNSGTDDATVANHREYDSFGNLTDETSSSVNLLFGFTSRPFDETTLLQNNLHRWYDAAVGRWISEDPIGFAGGVNTSGYVNNAPTMATDPLGLFQQQAPSLPPFKFSPLAPERPNVTLPQFQFVPQGSIDNMYQGYGSWSFTGDQYEAMRQYFLGLVRSEGWLSLTPAQIRQLERGCVGLALFRLGYFGAEAEGIAFPHNVDGAKLFDNLPAAQKYRDKVTAMQKKEYRIFAMQLPGAKIDLKPGRVREDGEVFTGPDGDIVRDRGVEAIQEVTYNFASWIDTGKGQGFWEYMPHSFKWGGKDEKDCPTIEHSHELPSHAMIDDKLGDRTKYLNLYGVAPVKPQK